MRHLWLAILLVAFVVGSVRAAEPRDLRIPAHPLEVAAGGPAELDAVIWPQSGPGPHRAAVLLHGCAGLRGDGGAIRSRDAQWARLLAAEGFVVLHVDSFTPRGERSICAQREDVRRVRVSVERARDAYAALLFLQARSDIRADAVALMGWSNGGGTVLWAMAPDSRARPADLGRDFAVAVAFYPGCRSLSLRRAAWQPVAPLLLLVGEADDWTPAPPCMTLAARAGDPVDLHVYPGAHHDFDAPDQPVRRRGGVGATASGMATLGTDPAAREDALRRVPAFLAQKMPPR